MRSKLSISLLPLDLGRLQLFVAWHWLLAQRWTIWSAEGDSYYKDRRGTKTNERLKQHTNCLSIVKISPKRKKTRTRLQTTLALPEAPRPVSVHVKSP